MTLLTPGYEQAIGYTARIDRLGLDALFGGPGIDYGMQVVPSSGMTVSITPGRALIKRTDIADQGSYLAYNDSSGLTATIGAADPTYLRIDLIVVHIYDTALGDVKDGAYLEVVPGIVNSGVPPATPSNSALLATINVTAGLTTVGAANIHDVRTFAGAPGSPGDIMWTSQENAPSGWLFARGQALSRAAFPDLNAVYARQATPYPWGNGDGATTFNVPNLDDRVIQGCGPSTQGTVGGEGTHTLVAGETPLVTHSHTINDGGHVHGVTDPTHSHITFTYTTNDPSSGVAVGAPEWSHGATTFVATVYNYLNTGNTSGVATGISIDNAATGITVGNTGAAAGSAHNNRQPFTTMWALVKT